MGIEATGRRDLCGANIATEGASMATRRTSSRKAGKQEGERESQARSKVRGSERGTKNGGAAKSAGATKTGPAKGTTGRTPAKKAARPSTAGGERRRTGNGERRARAMADVGRGGVRPAQGRERPRGNGRKQSEREIEEMFGFVPSFYDAMPDSAFQHAWGLQRDLELAETSLDPMTKELIGLAMASHIKCRYCIYFHTEAALHHGATHEQLQEAIAMGGLTVLWSNCLSGAQIDLDRFHQEVDRALEHIAQTQPSRPKMREATA